MVLLGLVLGLVRSADAQEPTRSSLEVAAVGRQTANQVTSLGNGSERMVHEQLFGGGVVGYSFALTPKLALEARGGYLFGHQPQISQDGGEQILAHVGLRATVPLGHSHYALRARVAPGIASFSSGVRSEDLTYTFDPSGIISVTGVPRYGRITHFSLEDGVGLSTRLSRRTYLNLDVSQEIMLDGDRSESLPQLGPNLSYVFRQAYVEEHALVTVGLSRFFGREFAPEPQIHTRADAGLTPRNELVFSYVVQPTVELSQRTLTNEFGFAITGSHLLKRWLALDSSIVYLPHGDIPNYQDGGSQLQFFTGVRFGLQHERYGIFGKVRPGLISISHTDTQENTGSPVVADDFGGDLGAVIELYPARGLVLRVDLGEMLIRYGGVTSTYEGVPGLFAAGSNYHPPVNSSNGQFLIGAGWRF